MAHIIWDVQPNMLLPSYMSQIFKSFSAIEFINHNFSCQVLIGLKLKIRKLKIQRSEVIIQV